MRLGFLASNNGSSLRAIVAAIETGSLTAEPRLVVSNNKAARALTFARERGVPSLCIPTTADPARADARLAKALTQAGVDLVVLSGYLRKLGPKVLAAYEGRILNIHPSLLPKYGGRGMYGRRVHEAVIAGREPVTGASVHLVDDQYDHGEVLAWIEIPVSRADTAGTIEAKVMAAEPALFVATLRAIAAGTLKLPMPDPKRSATGIISDNLS
ncbi:MAG: phosphoribosylglycinamide formyltransferase [Caulobacteraceae bacterium]